MEESECRRELPRDRRSERRRGFSGGAVGKDSTGNFVCWQEIDRVTIKTFWLSLWLGLAVASAGAQEAWQRVHEAGSRAAKEARFADAEKLLSQSVREARHLSELSPLLARSLLDLAEVYRTEGRYTEAQPCYEEALKIDSKQHGPESLEVAEVLDRQAELFKTLTDYSHAELALQRSL